MTSLISCPGCGIVTETELDEGPTHPYIGASAGCWSLFTELLVVGAGLGGSGQLVTDTYAVQHPGVPERRATQSVCVHLISICAQLEHGWPAHRVPDLLRKALTHPTWWRWLDPRPPIGSITVDTVLTERDAGARGRLSQAWAEDLWLAYAPHHATVQAWLDDLR
jgi:hypothetical protein